MQCCQITTNAIAKGRTVKFLRGGLGNFFVHVFFSPDPNVVSQ